MKNLEDQMASYAAYHQDARNEVFFALGYKPELRQRIKLNSAARTAPKAPSA